MQERNEFLKFLFKRELIKVNENIYHAPQAFKINAIMSWCSKQTNQEVLHKSLLLVERFMAGDIDIQLKDNKLKVRKIKKRRKQNE